MSGFSLVLLSCFFALMILTLTLWHCSPAGTRRRQAWHRPLLLALAPLAALVVGYFETPALFSFTGPIAPAALMLLLLPQWWLMRGTFHCRTCATVYFDPSWTRHVAYRCQVCRGYHAHGHAFSWHRGRSDADLSEDERIGPPTVFGFGPHADRAEPRLNADGLPQAQAGRPHERV